LTLFNSDKLNDFLAEKLQEILPHVNRNGNGNSNNGKRNGKQQLTLEEAWEKVAEEYTKFVCSLEPFDFSRLKLVVDPGTRSDNTATWLFRDGHYQEVKLKHFLSQQVKLLLEEDLRALFGLNKSEIISLFLRYYDDSLINSYAKKLTAFSPQREEVNWNFYIRHGLDVIWLSDGKRILVNNEGEITVEKEHQDHNLFAIPANIAKRDNYKEPSFFLNLVESTFGEASSAWLDLMALLLSPSDTSKIVTFLVGPANSGKSTWLDVFELIYGSSAVAPITLKHLNEKSFHLSRFLTRLIVFAHETSRERAEDSTLKWIASRDVLFVDRKFLSAIEGRAIARLVVATNNIPIISDYSDGFVERVWFFELGKLKEKLPKTQIFKRIEEEAADIRRYLILRLAHLRKHGLSPETTDYLKQARQRFLVLQNVVAAFLSELWTGEINIGKLVQNEELIRNLYEKTEEKIKIGRDLIWPLFIAWCRDSGKEPLSKANFLEAIKSLPIEYLPFTVSRKVVKIKKKPHRGFELVAKPVTEVTPTPSQGVTDETVDTQGVQESGYAGYAGYTPEGENVKNEETAQQKKVTSTPVTSVTTVTNTSKPRNIKDSSGYTLEDKNVTKCNLSKEETSPDFFSSRVGDFSPAGEDCVSEELDLEQEPSSEKEGTIEEVLSLDEAVPLEDEEPYAEPEEPYEAETDAAEAEEQAAEDETEELIEGRDYVYVSPDEIDEPMCKYCVHFPIEAGYLRTGKVCRATGELTWWGSGVCKHYEEREGLEEEEEKQATQKQREEVVMKKASPKRKQSTKPAKQVRKQKQAKKKEQRNETIQERVEKVARSAAFYEEIIKRGHERLLEEILFWEGRAA